MYQEEYKRWLAADLQDADLNPELSKIEGNDEEIKDRFAVALKFGTAGLRGVLGAGTNRMNIYVVRQATQGLANWVKTQGGNQTVAISYDSRLKSDVFAKTAAGVLAANDINVRIYDALMPVPALSFATRYYECNAGIMVTASHNPAKYNGYKAYGPDGCQMTDDAAAIVYEEIQKTDVLTGAKYMSFAEGVEQGKIRFVGDDCKQALYEAIESRQVRPGLCKTAGLKLVYSPLNGSGLVPVTQVLKDIGITDITIVPEQEYPNGYFTTCSYPNPEIFAALELGLNLAKETGADLMLATDPDADRVGIAMKCPDGSYELVTGNEVGVLLLDAGADGVEVLRHLEGLLHRDVLRRVGVDGKGQPLQRDAALRAEIGDVPLRVNAGVRAAAASEVHRCAGDLLQRLLQRLADGDGVFLHLPAVVGRSIIHQFQCDITHIGSFNDAGRVIFPRKRARRDPCPARPLPPSSHPDRSHRSRR